jgi:peroxiredoxin
MDLERIPILRKLAIGNPAIPIEAATSDGTEITLETYKGKVLLLDFWASWCAPCRQEMPNVKKVYNDFHSKGFEIVGISLDDTSAKFRGYVEEQQMPWPQIFDGKGWNSEVGRTYAVNVIPATFLLDRKGTIRYRNLRGGRGAHLREVEAPGIHPSRWSSLRFMGRPRPKPPREPSEAMTRWHGTMMGMGFAPTA